MKEDQTAKLVKLLGVALELHNQQGDLLAEINAILGGGAGIGAQLKRLYASFSDVWALGYGGHPYVFAFAKDAPQMKRLLKAMGVEELEARFATYLQSREEFIVRAKHSFPMFVATVNQHAGIVSRTVDPCEADAQATRQRRKELVG